MPIRSMTGFGQAEATTLSGTYRLEIRGVNNRYLDVQLRLPRSFSPLEQRIKKTVTEKISRGYVTVNVTGVQDNDKEALTWDKPAVEAYLAIFNEIKDKYRLAGDVSLSDLLHFSDFIKAEPVEFDEEATWKQFEPVLKSALKNFQKSREAEAFHIAGDMRKMLSDIERALARIQKRAPLRIKKYSRELKKRIEQLIDSQPDPQRVSVEVALMADRIDISEECTRLSAHISEFGKIFKRNEPVGKRMNFLLQEMNREANTIGSKANDTQVSHLSIQLKESIEKIREQVQNIE
ncbi:MAG: YicC family protein [Chitinivibrionales bacterium]|nr:YicC family protein [Chitinivibrionales bacterium]